MTFACRDKVLRPEIEKALVREGGTNLYGQPNYRLVWGYARREFYGGTEQFRYGAPERHLERWHLERWMPPSTYGTPQEWYETAYHMVNGEWVNVLGEFPAQGEYERILTFEHYQTQAYVEPSEDLVVEAVRRNLRLRERTAAQCKKQVEERMEAQKQKESDRVDARLSELEAAFPFKTWMPVSGPMTPESHRRAEYSGTERTA